MLRIVRIAVAGDPLDDDAENVVIRVAVVPGRSGREEQRPAADESQNLALALRLVCIRDEREVVADAGGMGQQMFDGDIGESGIELRYKRDRFVVQSQLTAFDEPHDPCGGELFGDRSDPIHGCRCGSELRRHVVEAVCFGEERFVAVLDGDADARNSAGKRLARDGINEGELGRRLDGAMP